MAVDLQVVFPQSVVPLSSVSNLPGMVPRSLNVIGQDFRSVAQVLINDIASPDVVILSKTRLLAQVPVQLANVTLTSVTVISQQLTMSPRSLIKFQLGTTPSKVSGILRLVQVFLKILLTTTGIDIFAPRIGGNALRDIGRTFGKDQGGNVVSDFIIAVSTTSRQITAVQARNPSIPRDERLLAAKVLSADFNRAEAALVVSVELTSQAGSSATANVMV
jgi:hypothetical protein